MFGLGGHHATYRQLERKFRARTSGAHGENARQDVIESIRRYLRAWIFRVEEAMVENGKDRIHLLIPYSVRTLPTRDIEILNEKLYEGCFFQELASAKNSRAVYVKALAELHDTAVICANGEADGRLWRELVDTYIAEKETSDAQAIVALQKKRAARVAFLSRWGWQTLIISMLLVAVFNDGLSYSYYMIVRFACCAAFGLWGWHAHKMRRPGWRNAFGLIAAAYNPFLPLKLEEEWWQGINVVTILFALLSGFISSTPARADLTAIAGDGS